MRSVWQDLRFGLRQLWLSPGFAAVGILSLALGIGANTAIFQLIDAIRLRTIPVSNPETVATIRLDMNHWGSGSFYGAYAQLTYPIWEQIAARQTSFSKAAVWGGDSFNLATGGETHYARGLWVGGDFFDVLGLQPYLGRLIRASDDVPGCSQTGAVLSYAFWQQNYGGDPAMVGKRITLNGYPFEVIGVTPPKFTGVAVGEAFDVAVPVCAEPNTDGGEDPRVKNRRAWWLASVARLKPGVTLPEANAQLNVISPQVMEQTLPAEYDADGVKHYLAYKLEAHSAATGFSALRSGSETGLWLLMGISGLVLLIACANIANLMLARASSRGREIAVRLALGASRGRLMRQLLSESLLLAVAGAVLGSLIAWSLSSWLIAFLTTPRNQLFVDLSLDWRVLAFTTALAFLTTMLFGLIPALRATNTSPNEALKAGGRGITASREKFGLRRLLVVSQVALSLVLLVGALLFVRSLRNLFHLDTGFQQNGILLADLDFTRVKVPQSQMVEYQKNLIEKLRAIPGVDAAAGAVTTPLRGRSSNDDVLGDTPDIKLDSTKINAVSADYFKTFETRLLEGRDFNDEDTPTSPKVAIVNQAFVKKFLKGEDGVGKTFRLAQEKGAEIPVLQIVGVSRDAIYQDIHEDFQPTAYFPLSQEKHPDAGVEVVLRSNEQLSSLMGAVKTAVGRTSPEIDIDFRVFKTQVAETLRQDELMATLTGFFGVLAGLLAVIGLYGVISYMVAQRRNEIGVRMAMGAQRADVLQMVMRDAALMVGIGIVVGTVLALFAAKSTATILFGLKPHDPLTYVACIAGLAIVAALASLVPARRAAKLDPWTALRDE
jgi:putative ABC transport system permease protein